MMIVVAAAGGCAQSVSVNFGNPSEANCKKQGGVLRTEKGADADRNTCVLPDGSAFEEWVQHARQPPNPTPPPYPLCVSLPWSPLSWCAAAERVLNFPKLLGHCPSLVSPL